jgi:hypothetical protein
MAGALQRTGTRPEGRTIARVVTASARCPVPVARPAERWVSLASPYTLRRLRPDYTGHRGLKCVNQYRCAL